MSNLTNNDNLITIKDLAQKLKVSERTIRGWTKQRIISKIQIGYRTVRYHYPTALDEVKKHFATTSRL